MGIVGDSDGYGDQFTALAQVGFSLLGEARVLLSEGGLPVRTLMPDSEVVSVESDAELFRMISSSDKPCVVFPTVGRGALCEGSCKDVVPLERPIVVVVPASYLESRLPRLVAPLGSPRLIIRAHARSIHTGIQLGLVLVDPPHLSGPELVRFFDAPPARQTDDVAAAVVDLERLLVKQGGATKFGYVYRGEPLTGRSLRPEDYNPEVDARSSTLLGSGEALSSVRSSTS